MTTTTGAGLRQRTELVNPSWEILPAVKRHESGIKHKGLADELFEIPLPIGFSVLSHRLHLWLAKHQGRCERTSCDHLADYFLSQFLQGVVGTL